MQRIQPIFVDSIPSTNEAVKALGREGAPEGILMVARMQTHGYGRLSRAFFSPPDTGLYMSLLLRPTFEAEHAPLLTHAAALAVAEAITEVSGRETAIKWVNDVYLDGKKAAGILVESALAPSGVLAYTVLGVGINLFVPESGFPPNVPATAVFPASRRAEAKELRDALVRAVTARFAALYDEFPDTAFLAEYRRRSVLLGAHVTVFDALTDREKQGKGRAARAIDITERGALLVEFEDGTREALSSGEVTIHAGAF